MAARRRFTETVDTGLDMSPGTSPAIVRTLNGWAVAYQAPNGELHIHDSAGNTQGTGLGLDDQTSPAIAKQQLSDWVVAFQANGIHELWLRTSDGATQATGLAMMPGTSPAIAYTNINAWAIAYQAPDGELRIHDSSGQTHGTQWDLREEQSCHRG